MTTFEDWSIKEKITESAFPILVSRGGDWFASGTAVLIGPHLAITARHVIEDIMDRYEEGELATLEGVLSGSFKIKVLQVWGDKREGIIWEIGRTWLSPDCDIAILELSMPDAPLPENFEWRVAKYSLRIPIVGDFISAFGFRESKIELIETKDIVEVHWADKPTLATGVVRAVHKVKRDNYLLPFPCFQTNARFDGGMSGGPVFDRNGILWGIVCSNTPPYEEGEEHASYVSLLWPLLATIVDFRMKNVFNSAVELYPFEAIARTYNPPEEMNSFEWIKNTEGDFIGFRFQESMAIFRERGFRFEEYSDQTSTLAHPETGS